MRGGSSRLRREVARPRPPRGRATDARISRASARAAAGGTRVGNRNVKEREKAKRTQRSRTPGGAGNMLSGRTSTCAPARADPGYLEDQIAFGVTLLFGNVGAEASPPFRALFLKILQDLENKRETRDSRKRARRARSAGRIGGRRSSRGVRGRAGRVRAHTGCTNTETSGTRRGLGPYTSVRGRHAAPARRGRASPRRRRRRARRAAAGRGSSAHNTVTAMSPPPPSPCPTSHWLSAMEPLLGKGSLSVPLFTLF